MANMIDEWSPDPDIDCTVPYVLPSVVAVLLGAAVIMAALVVAAVKRVRRGNSG